MKYNYHRMCVMHKISSNCICKGDFQNFWETKYNLSTLRIENKKFQLKTNKSNDWKQQEYFFKFVLTYNILK